MTALLAFRSLRPFRSAPLLAGGESLVKDPAKLCSHSWPQQRQGAPEPELSVLTRFGLVSSGHTSWSRSNIIVSICLALPPPEELDTPVSHRLNKWPFQLPPDMCRLPFLTLCFSLVVSAVDATQASWRLSCLNHDTPGMLTTCGSNREKELSSPPAPQLHPVI